MPKIIMVPWLPWGYGFTLWKLVIVSKQSTDIKYVIEHEKVHVEQWTRLGFFRFPYLYIKELIKNGYYKNKYEIQARVLGSKRSREK